MHQHIDKGTTPTETYDIYDYKQESAIVNMMICKKQEGASSSIGHEEATLRVRHHAYMYNTDDISSVRLQIFN